MTTTLIIKKKEDVVPKHKYSDYREDLREEAWYSCCYCSISEAEATGIRFEIDHYLCQEKYPHKKNEYNNLFWSCEICNRLKSNHPSAEASKKGYKVFKPDEHPFEDHFELKAEKIQFKDELIGKYTVHVLDLNSINLMRLRKIRKKLYDSDQAIALGLRALKNKRIDEIALSMRGKYLKLKNNIETKTDKASDQINEFILKNLNRSENLDIDPQKAKRFPERQKFLKRLNVLTAI